jgi:hypothetical protein
MEVMEGTVASEGAIAVMAATGAWGAATEASVAAMEEDMATNIAPDSHVRMDLIRIKW